MSYDNSADDVYGGLEDIVDVDKRAQFSQSLNLNFGVDDMLLYHSMALPTPTIDMSSTPGARVEDDNLDRRAVPTVDATGTTTDPSVEEGTGVEDDNLDRRVVPTIDATGTATDATDTATTCDALRSGVKIFRH